MQPEGNQLHYWLTLCRQFGRGGKRWNRFDTFGRVARAGNQRWHLRVVFGRRKKQEQLFLENTSATDLQDHLQPPASKISNLQPPDRAAQAIQTFQAYQLRQSQTPRFADGELYMKQLWWADDHFCFSILSSFWKTSAKHFFMPPLIFAKTKVKLKGKN